MDLVAATATAEGMSTRGWVILVLMGLGAVVVYVFACWFWPFTACGKCKGSGRFKSPSGKNWRKCPRCKGNASRLRIGRRIFNWLHVTSKEASK